MRGAGHNHGIQMSGGRIEAGALAVGRGAHAHNVVMMAKRELETEDTQSSASDSKSFSAS
jgi:hypothetical protein